MHRMHKKIKKYMFENAQNALSKCAFCALLPSLVLRHLHSEEFLKRLGWLAWLAGQSGQAGQLLTRCSTKCRRESIPVMMMLAKRSNRISFESHFYKGSGQSRKNPTDRISICAFRRVSYLSSNMYWVLFKTRHKCPHPSGQYHTKHGLKKIHPQSHKTLDRWQPRARSQ